MTTITAIKLTRIIKVVALGLADGGIGIGVDVGRGFRVGVRFFFTGGGVIVGVGVSWEI